MSSISLVVKMTYIGTHFSNLQELWNLITSTKYIFIFLHVKYFKIKRLLEFVFLQHCLELKVQNLIFHLPKNNRITIRMNGFILFKCRENKMHCYGNGSHFQPLQYNFFYYSNSWLKLDFQLNHCTLNIWTFIESSLCKVLVHFWGSFLLQLIS